MMPQRITIVGGGTAGWMAANLLAHHWREQPIDITLVESPDIGIIGVGEGSTPSLKRFFEDLGISESQWMSRCKATYKVNIQFSGWSPNSGVHSYSHPFISQLDTFSERPFQVNCYTRRLGLDVQTDPAKFLFNGWLAKHNLQPNTPEHFPFNIEYGYHFDSGLLGQFLCEHSQTLGVKHLQRKIEHIKQHPDGSIASLQCDNGEMIDGDMFIDCTGFQSLLLQKTLNVPFTSFKDNLFNDAAVVFPTHTDDNQPVETKATALSNGWAWQIPLTHRTGNGYVFSREFITPDQAEHEFRQHLGLLDSDIEARHLQMNVGQVSQHWYKNCIGLGLSQGFIEPLEATALHLVQTSVERFIDEYESGHFSNKRQDNYNKIMTDTFERVRDYIVAHYKLNTRDDSEYWIANRNNEHISRPLLELLDVWFRRGDLTQHLREHGSESHFNATSWHCLLSGYGAYPPLALNQPGTGDLYIDNDLESFFSRCLLNFGTSVNG